MQQVDGRHLGVSLGGGPADVADRLETWSRLAFEFIEAGAALR